MYALLYAEKVRNMTNQQEFVDKMQHKDIEFEYQAHRIEEQTTKAILSYDKSLARARAAGYERHPRPDELFRFLVYCIENKLQGSMEADDLALTADGIDDIINTIHKGNLYADMQFDRGEWLSAVWQVKKVGSKQLLTHYADPHGLVLVNESYVPQDDFGSMNKHEFDVTGIPLQVWVPLDRFAKGLQVHLYTRSFRDLPREMRENEDPKKNAALYLPPEGIIWPVGRRCHGRYAIGCHKTERASRGVYSLGMVG